jgi:hypothetical protein
MTIFAIGLISLWMISVNLLITRSQFGGVIITLARLGFKLIPPALWVGAVLIVVLWLAVLHRAWRQNGRGNR